MKIKTEPTLVERAIAEVSGFAEVFNKLKLQVTLRGQSKSTLDNYIRRIASVFLHFSALPEMVFDWDVWICPSCKTGRLIRLEELPKIRSPGALYELLNSEKY